MFFTFSKHLEQIPEKCCPFVGPLLCEASKTCTLLLARVGLKHPEGKGKGTTNNNNNNNNNKKQSSLSLPRPSLQSSSLSCSCTCFHHHHYHHHHHHPLVEVVAVSRTQLKVEDGNLSDAICLFCLLVREMSMKPY